jgi:hypothetical protein
MENPADPSHCAMQYLAAQIVRAMFDQAGVGLGSPLLARIDNTLIDNLPAAAEAHDVLLTLTRSRVG